MGKGYSLILDSSMSPGQRRERETVSPQGETQSVLTGKAVSLRETASATKSFVMLPQRETMALNEGRRAIKVWYCLFNGTSGPLSNDVKVFCAT